jgi:hypothetical protein
VAQHPVTHPRSGAARAQKTNKKEKVCGGGFSDFEGFPTARPEIDDCEKYHDYPVKDFGCPYPLKGTVEDVNGKPDVTKIKACTPELHFETEEGGSRAGKAVEENAAN